MWNEDEAKGKADQAKGEIKKKTGELLDDQQMQDEGRADKAAGEVRETVGKVQKGIDRAADKVKDSLDR
ncbi:MAG: CsbD family protein [Vicinamibacterales bacterium]